MSDERRIVDTQTAAKLFGYKTTQTIFNQRNLGDFPGILGFTVGRRLFFDLDELVSFIAENGMPPYRRKQ